MAYTNFNFTSPGYTPTYDFDFAPIEIDEYTIKPYGGNNFVAIWADPTASLDSGMMYITTDGSNTSMYVVKLATQEVYDVYSQEISGRAQEALDYDDPVDMNAT